MTDSDNNKEIQPKKTRKGKTNNPSGRPKGSGNKISGVSIISALQVQLGRTYEEQLAVNYNECLQSGDRIMVAKYDQMFLNKVVGDLTNIDVTTAGESVKGAFTFLPVEMKEWRND